MELRRLLNRLKPVAADDLAQDLAEYGIALAVIGLGAALAAIAVAGNVNEIWAAASSVIGEAI